MKKKIEYYDTTLRDGSQAAGVSFSLADKLKITREMDRLGIHYVEGGWPGSNEKDIEYFQAVRKLKLKRTRVSAFGSTRHHKNAPERDPNLAALVKSGTTVVCIFGKSWDFQVREALRVPLEKNLEMIYDSVKFLKSRKRTVIYDAEHFFDGYKSNPAYALKTLQAALEGGADNVTLCDTNGGTLTFDLVRIIEDAKSEFGSINMGIHAHNDSDLAVVNSLYAVQLGAVLVQGTMNGIGERCGNANLCSIIPSVELKMGKRSLSPQQLAMMMTASRYISELANMPHNDKLPYVGENAFTHKGGIHVSAILRNPFTYEHINPELVGNRRKVLVSELAGKSNILYKARELGIRIPDMDSISKEVVNRIKRLENEGFQFEGAEGSFELLIKKATGEYKPVFRLIDYRLILEKEKDGQIVSEATIKLEVNGREYHTVSEGHGPVNALDNALRKSLQQVYPALKKMKLYDYKVRVLNEKEGTAAKVRVLVQSKSADHIWGTIGVSENIIDASWQALVDSIEYFLLKIAKKA